MSNTHEFNLAPNHLFEVSWEVCNKVGGIHTVIASKAKTVVEKLGDHYILIGPDIHRGEENLEFEEEPTLLADWRESLFNTGIRIRVGRWKINGQPLTVLVDFTELFPRKDEMLKRMWERYQVDSISGQWDYIEPVLFGFASAKVIESYVQNFCSPMDKSVSHFHEWMTSSGGLYLMEHHPNIATVFTTHATVMGRSIAGNGMPLYGDLTKLNADDLARKFGVTAKHSLEKTAAKQYDCFTTVSDLTARECKHLLQKEVDLVTPNGFEDDFVWEANVLEQKRKAARKQMISIAEICLGIHYDSDPLIVGTSGRYEFRNKGLDLFVDSLIQLANNPPTPLKRPILAYITVPAGNVGPRKDLQAHLQDPSVQMDPTVIRNITHYLSYPEGDPIINKIKNTRLMDPSSPIQVMFVPSYLNGVDGIFDKDYYELFCGMDLTAFPSYYEPWGYTPLESVSFGIPTITTSLTGFGLWVAEHGEEHKGVEVIDRNDNNDPEVVSRLASSLEKFSNMSAEEYGSYRKSAVQSSEIALWKNLYIQYARAYDIALENMAKRSYGFEYDGGGQQDEQINFVRQQLVRNRPIWSRLMVERTLPPRLHPLEEISKNLWWSWHPEAYELWEYINYDLWVSCEKNPIDFLDKLRYSHLLELAKDEVFLSKMDTVYRKFKSYMAQKKEAKGPKIGYFSMEYGLHSSLKIYSGGLGILAGDYLKEASDKNVPLIAVGLLYRYGYFTQRLSSTGNQEASYEPQNFAKLPITPARDEQGNWLSIQLGLPGRVVTGHIWRCDVGRTELYLIDTDHSLNREEDRSITHHLYGGDWENRLKQEMLLGIGGIRLMHAIGAHQDVYHCNEGHAAFMGIERIRDLIDRHKLSFSEAFEVVRSSTLFTTHTPVPAGHDAFSESMIRQYMGHYPDRLGITWDQFISLGRTNPNDPNEKFSMSFLACNLSQEVNGVSWLHGEVSKEILGGMWPGYFKNELHVGYVTNGVHFYTWCATNMQRLYAKYFPGGFSLPDYSIQDWQKVHEIPDNELWAERLVLKNKLIAHVKKCLGDLVYFRFNSPAQMLRIYESLKPDVLTIGFARRFATYKRAHLLFTNLDRLDAIVNNPERPVQFLFAGKAHPNDQPGQDLIKRIVEVASMPRFAGKVIFLQNYDMELARRMVQGVDIWLNTPTRPQEASGTSGEKAVMNGTMHFSVLDGWWVEGYHKGGGWRLPMERSYEDQNFQNELDAELIYTTIENDIVPKYYNRDADNIPHEWIEAIKICIADIAPNFTTNRMMTDYQERFYNKLYQRDTAMRADDFRMAREIATWKRKISNAWDQVRVISAQRIDIDKETILVGHSYNIGVVLDIAGLKAEEIGVEMIVADQIDGNNVKIVAKRELKFERQEGSLVFYRIDSTPDSAGSFDTSIRVFPKNEKLPHRMDFALVKWA